VDPVFLTIKKELSSTSTNLIARFADPRRAKNMASTKRRRVESHNGSTLEEKRYPSSKYKCYLACPFSKHDPDLYMSVNNVCTVPPGFKDIGDLNYHIKRVHSLELGCILCKSRFTQSKKRNGQSKDDALKQAKLNHACEPRDFVDEDPQWMTQEQEKRLAKWKEGKAQEGGAKSWVKIYMCLFKATKKDVPSPYYDYFIPSHLLSNSATPVMYQPPIETSDPAPSFTQSMRRNVQATRDPGPSDQQPRLNINAFNMHRDSGEYPFDWTVTPAIDSGYGTQDQHDGESSIPSDPSSSIELYPLHSDTSAAVMFTTGNSEASEVNYTEYLNVDEDTIREVEE